MSVLREPQNGRETILATTLLAFALWLLQHPYLGLYQDAVIYALLAARQLHPEAYARDLFFLFGSQDGFSIFSPLYALLIGQLGLDAAARTIVLLGAGLWVLACLGISRSLLGDTWYARWCALFLATTSLAYTPNFSTFTLNESIATARQLALPLGLMCVAFAFAGRQALAWATGLAATLIHPLIGIWPLVFLVTRRWSDRWFLIALVAAFAIVLSGRFWLPTDLLDLMDPQWEAVVRASTKDVFAGSLGTLRLEQILAVIGVLWLGGRRGDIRFRRSYLVFALLSSMAILLSVVCSYFIPVRLVLQIQPWRVMWLAIPLAMIVFCDLAGRSWRDAQAWMDRRRQLALAALATLALIMLPAYYVSLEIAGNSLHAPLFAFAPVIDGFLICGGAGLGLALYAVLPGFRPTRHALLVLSLPMIIYAASEWDARSPFLKRIEDNYLSATGNRMQPGQHMRRGDVVLWPGQGVDVWFVLGTANYAIDRQTTGLIFSARKTAEARRRLERISLASLLAGQGAEFEAMARGQLAASLRATQRNPLDVNSYGDGVPTEAGVAYLCQDAELDWVVSGLQSVSGHRGLPFDLGRNERQTPFLYRCGAFRRR